MTVRGSLEGGSRRRVRGARRVLRSLSTVLLIAGVLLIADAILTVTWQEPLSAYLASRSQSHLSHDLDALERAAPTQVERRALVALHDDRRRIAFLARRLQREAQSGEAVGRIRIPEIGASFVVVDGDDTEALRKGPGIYPNTSFPGTGGTTAIAGHRTTYLAPFRHIDALHPGDHIELRMPYGRFTYKVQTTKIVQPDAWWITKDVGYGRLVLSACHPLYSAAKRIVVFARQIDVQPLGSAAGRISDQGTASSGR